MTDLYRTPSILGPDYEAIAAKYRPIFARIQATALQREQQRQLGHDAIQWLKDARFGALRVPVEHGGDGATLPQLFQLLVELAEADSNIVQALRGHFAFVEDRLNAPRDAANIVWLRRFADGDLAGNAWTEVGNVTIGDVITRVTQKEDGRWVVNGRKFYSTGSIFADWIDLYARRDGPGDGDGLDVIAAVRARQPGVTHHDDWDGFGQRTTGSGTSVYENAEVEAENLFAFADRFKYQTAFYQLFHLATLAGIARAITRDAAAQVRGRKRIFSTGNAPSVAQDVQVQQVVGEVSAIAYAAEATAVRAAFAAQRAYDAHWHGTPEQEKQANIEAELESAQGQVALTDLVLRAASQFFNGLGASAASSAQSLDRHWRNARTVASHNPVIYKARIVGDWHINGTEPPYVWQIGAGPGRPTAVAVTPTDTGAANAAQARPLARAA
ncbi:acyl-CoA dehydrogenase family protein [Acidovorax sp. NCPPB 3576]|uniref:acyl-CoA dehydrogenase family protein n=1 Tax=Acidovorax sp. NCPPB 3576 TaxID=2940488 RepID=UPI00234A02F4|nr:acyl-CoA dehydrogenase family protein [Acidovorax sp. NCPPB 3576]WCM88635.1 acyl-CoA dehydrogenase family protein [Acidovorax sp. NCPPB 3576]